MGFVEIRNVFINRTVKFEKITREFLKNIKKHLTF
jgi:hypothetical protein